MCDGDVACGPCSTASMTRNIAVVQQADQPRQELGIWGPMSVEMPSEDDKLVRIAAVERALPGLLRRARFSMMHQDMAVGEIKPLLSIDQARLPPDQSLRSMVAEVVGKHGGLPTAILPVTQAIAEVFPKLRSFIGKPVAFAGGALFEDDRIGLITRQGVLSGKLDSFSIMGSSFKSRPIQYCDPTGCRQVMDVQDLDLSMVTLCSSQPNEKTPFGSAQARNPAAAFVVVQQASATSSVPITFNGVRITVENGKGSVREGFDVNGTYWCTEMRANYGCVRNSEGADGDEVDCYVGDNLASDYVLVINQLKDGAFDEHKVMLGFDNYEAAVECYRSHYPLEFVVGPAKSMTVADFKQWLKEGDHSKPLAQADYTTATPGASNQTYHAHNDKEHGTVTECSYCRQANGTSGGVINQGNNGSSGAPMTPSPPAPVVQADGQNTEEKKVKTREYSGNEALFVEVMRRIEQVEQDVAVLKGQRPAAPSPGDQDEMKTEQQADIPAAPTTPAPAATSAPAVPTPPSPITQAAPADPANEVVTMGVLQQAIAVAMALAFKDPAFLETIKQAVAPPAAPVQVKQATKRVETPEPAASEGGFASDPEVETIRQALDSGTSAGFREVLRFASSQAKKVNQ